MCCGRGTGAFGKHQIQSTKTQNLKAENSNAENAAAVLHLILPLNFEFVCDLVL
jgi:hypothetical protein